jgi:hypothetical protein
MSKTIVSRSRLTENWLLRLEILLLALFPCSIGCLIKTAL